MKKLIIILLLIPLPVFGSATLHTGVTSEYNRTFGFGLYVDSFYTNFRMTMAERDDVLDIDETDAVGKQKSIQTDADVWNIGTVYTLHENLRMYSGVGIGTTTEVQEWFDSTGGLGDGTYYIETDEETYLNSNIGFLYSVEDTLIEVGYDSYSEEIYLGAGKVW